MKNILTNIARSLVLLFVAASLAFLSSCEEEEPVSDDVVLWSFGPSGVHHGDEIVFIGQNMDKVTSIVFKPEVTVERSEFKEASAESFKVVVPQGAEAGRILLNTPKGQVESKSLLNFKVDVVISSITPQAKPGTNITIKGSKINWIEKVTFASDLVVEKDDYVSCSQTEMVVTVPLAAQTGYLIFACGGTEPLTFVSEEELIVTAPTVTGLNPQSIRHTENLTITGANLDLITEAVFTPDVSVLKNDFVSQSATEIVVSVPAATETGAVILRQASPIEVPAGTLTITLPKGTSVTPTPAKPGEDQITIKGSDLDLVAEILFAGAESVTNFVSQSPTELVVAVPGSAGLGPINYVTVHGYSGGLGVVLIIPSEGPPPLIVTLYDDAIASIAGPGGGWNATTDFASVENIREGTHSIKVTYTQSWGGGAQFGTWGKAPISVAGTEVFAFSIYGVGNIGGQDIQVVVKDGTSEYQYMVSIESGAWKDVEIPLSEIGNITQVTEIFFQNTDQWTGTVFIDRVGFSMAGAPPALVVTLYEDAMAGIAGPGGGWGSTTDWENTENPRQGEKAIKVTYTQGWGGGAQFGTWGKDPISVAGTQVFAFSLFGIGDIDGQKIQVLVKDGTGEFTNQVSIESGKWNDIEIPLSSLGNITQLTELFFQNTDQWTGTVYIDFVGFR